MTMFDECGTDCRQCRVEAGEILCEQVVWRTGDLEQDSCDARAEVMVVTYTADGDVEAEHVLCSEHGKAAALAAAQIGQDCAAWGLP